MKFLHTYLVKGVLVVLLSVPGIPSIGQTISGTDIAELPKPVNQSALIVELNNDEYKDLVVTLEYNPDSIVAIVYFQNPLFDFSPVDTLYNLTSRQVVATDFNNNGLMDMVINQRTESGHQLTGYSDFDPGTGFHTAILHEADSIQSFDVIDVSNDGRKDILLVEIVGGKPRFSCRLQNETGGSDPFMSEEGVNKFLVADINNDAFSDFFLYKADSSFIRVLQSYEHLTWQRNTLPVTGLISDWTSGDLNSDGDVDLILLAEQGEDFAMDYMTFDPNGASVRTLSIYEQRPRSIYVGDFTNDGFFNIVLGFPSESILLTMDENADISQSESLALQDAYQGLAYGDIESDGDLDWIGYLIDGDILKLRLLSYTFEETNDGPKYVFTSLPITIGGITTFTWQPAIDDKSPIEGLSYDFMLRSDGEDNYIVAPDYDQKDSPKTGRRNVDGLGNTGFNKAYKVAGLKSGRYYWGVAGMDNAYYSGTDIGHCNSSVEGPPGPNRCNPENFSSQCFDLSIEEISACKGEVRELSFGSESDSVIWSSELLGILGYGQKIEYTTLKDDYVSSIAFNVAKCLAGESNCVLNYSLTINVIDEVEDLNVFGAEEETVCLDTDYLIEIQIPDSLADEVEYELFTQSVTIDISNPVIEITAPTTIYTDMVYKGCTFRDSLVVQVEMPPEISVEGDDKIYKGQSAHITASGAENYRWTPGINLNNPNSASVVAKPTQTTLYSITGWDTEDCESETFFAVEVLPSVFVPELFSPNANGRNDRLFVHGSGINDINFTLYNGEGTVVFRSESINEINGMGWDGQHNGNPIQPGVYLWTLSGSFSNGQPLTFQGKVKGQLKVIR